MYLSTKEYDEKYINNNNSQSKTDKSKSGSGTVGEFWLKGFVKMEIMQIFTWEKSW